MGVMQLSIDSTGQPPLPWLAQPLAGALQTHRGHALLVHAPVGLGSLQFVLSLAQSWLCEAAPPGQPPSLACGRCASCKLFGTHVHPDLLVLMPETHRRELAWPLQGDKADKGDGEDSKRKPSKQIRIDEVRLMIDWAQKTSARGRGKVAVLHPAEVLNTQSANALLKTLEEPAPGTRLILSVADPGLLLPTLRSRCQLLRLATPSTAEAAQWLAAQGVAQSEVLLKASSGRPLDALALSQGGLSATAWDGLPQAVARGLTAAFVGWGVPQLVDVLQKICHDGLAAQAGAQPRFFSAAQVPRTGQPPLLAAWAQALARVARHDGHAWREELLVESLVGQGTRAFAAAPVKPREPGRAAPT
jgi:DNA polymerase III subunit delta'